MEERATRSWSGEDSGEVAEGAGEEEEAGDGADGEETPATAGEREEHKAHSSYSRGNNQSERRSTEQCGVWIDSEGLGRKDHGQKDGQAVAGSHRADAKECGEKHSQAPRNATADHKGTVVRPSAMGSAEMPSTYRPSMKCVSWANAPFHAALTTAVLSHANRKNMSVAAGTSRAKLDSPMPRRCQIKRQIASAPMGKETEQRTARHKVPIHSILGGSHADLEEKRSAQ